MHTAAALILKMDLIAVKLLTNTTSLMILFSFYHKRFIYCLFTNCLYYKYIYIEYNFYSNLNKKKKKKMFAKVVNFCLKSLLVFITLFRMIHSFIHSNIPAYYALYCFAAHAGPANSNAGDGAR